MESDVLGSLFFRKEEEKLSDLFCNLTARDVIGSSLMVIIDRMLWNLRYSTEFLIITSHDLRIQVRSENLRDEDGVWKDIFRADMSALVVFKPSEGSLIRQRVKVTQNTSLQAIRICVVLFSVCFQRAMSCRQL